MRHLINERPLILLPTLVKLLGFERAAVLQQLHWLLSQPRSGKEINGHHWVYGTYAEWCEDYFTFWTPEALRKHINKLEKDEIIISCQPNATQWDRTKYYRIDYEKFNSLFDAEDCPHHADAASASNRDEDTASNRDEDTASNRDEDTASLIGTKTSTETSSLVAPESPSQEDQDLAIADEDEDKSLAFVDVPDFSLPTIVEPQPVVPPVADDDACGTKLLSNTLQNVGVGLTAYIVDKYMHLVDQFGIRAVVTGIENAADNHKQHRFAYVEKCILTAVEGGLGRMQATATPQSQLDFALEEVLL